MAITAEETTSIVQLVVGMAGVAPRPSDLADLVAEFEAGSSLVQIAQNIVDHPAYSGDTGLFPNYLPNSIWATQYLTMLIGGDVSAENLAAAIATTTADLNAGSTRAEVSVAAIDALAAETPAVGYEDAAATLANQTTVAEYYAVNSTAVDANITAMGAALAGVDSTAGSVTAATGAIDDVIAGIVPAGTLITNLDAANAAKAAFLTAAGTTEGAIGTGVATADAAIDVEVAGYDAATPAVAAALLSDEQTADAGVLTAANNTLTAALGATTGTASVTGLPSAVAVFEASLTTQTAGVLAAALAVVEADSALAAYNVLNGGAITLNANGTTSDATIILSGTSLVLGAGVTEATDPGVTVLLAATIANEAAEVTSAATTAAVEAALDAVENLDTTAARDAELILVAAEMTFVTPATTNAPTIAEMTAEQSALDAGILQLKADIAAVTYDTDDATTLLAMEAVLDAAETAGFISTADNVAILLGFGDDATADADFDPAGTDDLPAAIIAANAVVDTDSQAVTLAAAIAAYHAVGNGAQALALSPLALAADVADAAVTAAALEIATLSGLVDDLAEASANVAGLAAVNSDIADAIAAFADADLTVPVTLNSAVKAATAADDVFLVDGIDSQIIAFGDGGDDSLFIGTDLTLNADTTAGDEGNNAVLEVWITASGSDTVITIEETAFGSEAASPEIYAITLTGVASTDVSLADGFITVV